MKTLDEFKNKVGDFINAYIAIKGMAETLEKEIKATETRKITLEASLKETGEGFSKIMNNIDLEKRETKAYVLKEREAIATMKSTAESELKSLKEKTVRIDEKLKDLASRDNKLNLKEEEVKKLKTELTAKLDKIKGFSSSI